MRRLQCPLSCGSTSLRPCDVCRGGYCPKDRRQAEGLVQLHHEMSNCQKCIAGMMRIALRERAQRDAREKDEQARQKRIDEVEQELRRIEEEDRRVKTLEPEAVAWQQAQRIRECIAAV